MKNPQSQTSKYSFFSLLAAGCWLLIAAPLALAQDVVGTINPPQTVISTPEQTGAFITVIVRFITVIAGLYAMWQFLTGGFGYITSSGDKSKIQQSTQQIMMAIVGLAIIGASFILGAIIGRLLFGPSFNLFSPQLLTV